MRRDVEALLSAGDSGQGTAGPVCYSRVAGRESGSIGFKILATCGRGGGGTVYAARIRRTAVRWPSRFFRRFSAPEQRRRYLKEVHAASVLHHPAFVKVEESGTGDDRDYLVMEYVEGRTLGEVIPPRGLTVEAALNLARLILEGLAAAHSAGVIHRDLKPSNIMVTCVGCDQDARLRPGKDDKPPNP